MKPGLPTTFSTGRLESGKQAIIFGLPGNPVSAFVSAHLFALPLARHQMGLEWIRSVGTVIKVAVRRLFL
jgi:molybdopterin biosynthesis enzyme